MKKSPVIKIVAIGIGAALFFVLGHFVSIPSPVPNTSICIQYGLLGFMAALFGPIAGLLIGIIGHALSDLAWGSIWWSWVIASGVFGFIVGCFAKKIGLANGEFGKKGVLLFNIAQIVAHLVCWVGIAPALDILIYDEPVDKIFAQGLMAAGGNIVTTAIVGTLLCIAYAAAKPKKGSLKEEN